MRNTLVAVVAVLLTSVIAFAAVHRDTMSFSSAGTVYGSITPEGIAKMANYRVASGSIFTAADPNPTRAQLRAASFFPVNTTANAVDLDFSNDADLETADIGTTWFFVVTTGGTNALTVTQGGSGVAVTTLNSIGTTCEDVLDSIRCTAVLVEKVICVTACAD